VERAGALGSRFALAGLRRDANAAEFVRPEKEGGTLAGAAILVSAQLESRHPDIALPERRLAAAVLAEAIRCFRRYAVARASRERRLYRGAEEWIFVAPDDWLFSFADLCRALAIDPGYLRAGLRRWREAKVRAGRGELRRMRSRGRGRLRKR